MADSDEYKRAQDWLTSALRPSKQNPLNGPAAISADITLKTVKEENLPSTGNFNDGPINPIKLQFEVSDSGIGIPTEKFSKLFKV